MEETNPYLAMRAAKIARNEARLKELGLVRHPTQTHQVQARKGQPPKKTTSSKKEPSPPLRRSSRHSGRPPTYLELPPEPKRRKHDETQGRERSSTAVTPEQTMAKTFPPHSARSMDINVESLIIGGKLLGNMMEATGKAFVMEKVAKAASHDVHRISFNKYSGVQEWQNDALFLWVNLGKGGDVVNDFLNDGRQITWFGGSRMHEATKVIRRLLRVGKSVANEENESSEGVVLWCRSYDASKKAHNPYVCLGRLSYHSHEPGSRPLKFTWNLVDYDRIVAHKDETVRSTFEQLVNA